MDNWILGPVLAILIGCFWEIMSIGRKLDSIGNIDRELQEIRFKLDKLDEISHIYNELKWYEKDSSAAKILEHLDAIESAVKKLDLSR